MKLQLYAVALVATAFGTTLASFMVRQITISELGGLTSGQIIILMSTLIWFIVSFITYLWSRSTEGKPFGILSLDFFLVWVSCNVGAIIGAIIDLLLRGTSVNLESSVLLDSFLLYLPFTLSPTTTTTLGFRERNT